MVKEGQIVRPKQLSPLAAIIEDRLVDLPIAQHDVAFAVGTITFCDLARSESKPWQLVIAQHLRRVSQPYEGAGSLQRLDWLCNQIPVTDH